MFQQSHNEDPEFVLGSGNCLKHRGYADPEEMRLKFRLSNESALAVDQRKMPLARLAELTGCEETDLSRIINGMVTDYSVYKLMRVLA